MIVYRLAARSIGSTARTVCSAALLVAALSSIGCRKTPTPPPEGLTELPAGSFARSWVSDLKAQGDVTGLHLVNDQLYIQSDTNQLFAMSPASGVVRSVAQVATPGERVRRPVKIKEFIAVAHGSKIGFFDESGNKKREIELNYPIRSPLTVFGERLLLGIDGDNGGRAVLVTLDRPYIPILWDFLAGRVQGAPAVYKTDLYWPSDLGRVYACDDEKKGIWPLANSFFATEGSNEADLVVDEFGVYCASTDTKLYVLDRLSGRIRWVYYAQARLTEAPVVTADTVYQIQGGRGLVALTKAGESNSRTPKWTADGVRQIVSFDERHVYAVLKFGTLVALDKETGKELFRSKSRYDVFAMNPKDATIYAAKKNGQIVAIRPVLTGGTIGQLVMAETPAATN